MGLRLERGRGFTCRNRGCLPATTFLLIEEDVGTLCNLWVRVRLGEGGRREGGREEGGREGGREGGGGRKGKREGGKEGGRQGGREGGVRQGGNKGDKMLLFKWSHKSRYHSPW